MPGRAGAMRNRRNPSGKPPAAVYVVFFLSLSLLLSLGGWQWRRGLEKAAIEKLLEAPRNQAAANHSAKNQYTTIDRAPPNWPDLAYRQVRLEGDWRADRPKGEFLLANRIHRGRLGYEVFSPFQLAGDGATLLVNRGWVERADASVTNTLTTPSTTPPTTDVPEHAGSHVEVGGQLYLPKKGFTLGRAYNEQPDASPAWPRVIQYFDAPALSAALGTALQPAALALDSNHPAAFVRIWQAYTMTATRHYAYAAQWWGLAITLIVFGIIWRRQSARTTGGRDSRRDSGRVR